MGNHEQEPVHKSRHFVSTSMRVQGAIYAAFFMALSGTRLNKGYLEIFLHLKLYVDWFTLTALNSVLIWFVITATDWVDERLSWKENPKSRFSIQFWIICVLPYTACEFFNVSYGYYVGRDLFRSPYGIFEFPICLIFLMMLNLAYPFAKYVMVGQAQKTEEVEENAEEPEASAITEENAIAPVEIAEKSTFVPDKAIEGEIIVFGGKNGKTRFLKPDEVAVIIQQLGINTIYTFSLETFTCLGSLKGIYDPLDKEIFYKPNKKAVVNRKAIRAAEPREDGGLNIDVSPYYDEPISISHHEKKAFTNWYRKSTRSVGKFIMVPL